MAVDDPYQAAAEAAAAQTTAPMPPAGPTPWHDQTPGPTDGTPPVQAAPTQGPKNYDPQGAMGGLFAPAYIAGYAPSSQAVAAYQSGRAGGGNLSAADLESTRMPMPAGGSGQVSGSYPWTQYGPNLTGGNFAFGEGSIDPAALQAAAYNQPYDLQARRDQVAAALQQQNAARVAAAQPSYTYPWQNPRYAAAYGSIV